MAKRGSDKLPYIQFFTGDWVKDTRVLSLSARAIWMDMICLMHDGDKRGHLSRGGMPFSAQQLARFCGCTEQEIDSALAELLASGVASIHDGTIICRRILRDEKRRQTNYANGRKGGNPTLILSDNKSVNRPDNLTDKGSLVMELEYGNGVSLGVGVQGKGTENRKPVSLFANRNDGPERPEQWGAWLADEWASRFAGVAKAQKDTYAVRKLMDELIRQGNRPESIRDRIRASERNRAETTWEFEKFFTGTANVNGRTMGANSPARIRAEPGKYDGIGVTVGEIDPPAPAG